MLTYQKAKELMAAARNPAQGKPLENHTRLFQRGSDYAVQFHATDVVTLHRSGAYTLNSGGWRTVTTKARINQFGPVAVYSEKGLWLAYPLGLESPGRAIFKDGMRYTSTGRFIGAG